MLKNHKPPTPSRKRDDPPEFAAYIASRPALRKLVRPILKAPPEQQDLVSRVTLMSGLIPKQYTLPVDSRKDFSVLPGFLMLAHVDVTTKKVTEVLVEPMELWGRKVEDLGVAYMLKRLQDSNEADAPFGPDKRNTALWMVGTFAPGIPTHLVACTLENVSCGYVDGHDEESRRFSPELMRACLENLQQEFSGLAALDQMRNPADAPLWRHFSALHDMLALTVDASAVADRQATELEARLAAARRDAQQRFEKAQEDGNRQRKAAVAAKNVQIQSLEQRLRKQQDESSAALRAKTGEVTTLRAQLARMKASEVATEEAAAPVVAIEAPAPGQAAAEVVEDEDLAHWRETAEHQAEVIRQLRLSLQYVPTQLGEAAPATRQRKFCDLPDWIAENADRVIVLKRASHAVKKAIYDDEEFVFKALDMLATTYRDVKLGLADRMAYAKACEALGLDMGGSIAEAPGEEYFFQWKKRRTFLDQHIGKGNSRDPRYCFRCYFTWDAEEAKVVIGWLPSHLPTRTT